MALGFDNAEDVHISGNILRCPNCDGTAEIVSGTYDFVNGIVTAFAAEGVSRPKLEAFQDIARDVKDGRSTREQADTSVQALGGILVDVWRWANGNAGGISLLLTVLSIYIAIVTAAGSDEDAAKLRADLAKQTAIVQKIEATLQMQRVAVPKQVGQSHPTPQTQRLRQQQTPALATGPNRHERRKAARLSKRPS